MDRWVTAEIAQTLTDALNQKQWTPPFKAKRSYAPVRQRTNTLDVRVVPIEMSDQKLLNRAATVEEMHTVSISIGKAITDADNNEQIDPMSLLLQSIGDWARELKTIELTSNEVVAFRKSETLILTQALLDNLMFIGQINLEYKVIR